MSSGEDLRVLHAQANQVVNVEEAAIVDLFAGDAPVSEPIHLKLKQKVEQVEAAWITRCAVDVMESAIEQLLCGLRLLEQGLPTWQQLFPNAISFLALLRISAAVL